MEITNGSSKLTVDLSGGKIDNLTIHSVPLLGTFTRVDGARASSHLCVPNFDTEGMEQYNLPKHGPFRILMWQTIDKTDHSLTIRTTLEKTGTYPSTLECVQTFVLGEKECTHSVDVLNTGQHDAPINIAFHYYWHAPNGWESVRINNDYVGDLVKKDTHTDLPERSVIAIPGQQPVQLTSDNCPYVQLWTGRRESHGAIIYDKSYVCIEPFMLKKGSFGSPESMIAPGGTVRARITIALQ